MNVSIITVLFTLVLLVNGDIYLHAPAGSNNRLNERSAQRHNTYRVFDSQNNNRGGYNVADRLSTPARVEPEQYQMVYFQSSKLSKSSSGFTSLEIEWTNQHGCGGNEDDNPHNLNCQLVLQYMCQPQLAQGEKVRDGTSTSTQDYRKPPKGETSDGFFDRKKRNVKSDRAYQESFEWYDKCQVRARNKGLFTADQKVGPQAKNTRQNPNGYRHGYECPEERDYYPYWHPTEWKDIGVFAEKASMCAHYQTNSFNVHSRWECIEKWSSGLPKDYSKYNNEMNCIQNGGEWLIINYFTLQGQCNGKWSSPFKHYSKYNNEMDCAQNGGEWLEFHNYLEKAPLYPTERDCITQSGSTVHYIWGRAIYGYHKECLVSLDKPFCREAPFTRDNHLGNGVDLEPLRMTWKIPYFPSGAIQSCVLRMRYNISTDDYDPYHTDASLNENKYRGIKSPVQQNPTVDIGAQNIPLRLAINTAQYGRTFQDRTHVFLLKPRPFGGAAGDLNDAVIHNLNVRGKRGNIVQVYPAVEYDFFPTNLKMRENDLVHIQWRGSNTHNNENPGGDGQTGDEGQGASGTDRNNIVALADRNHNFPLDMDHKANIFMNVEVAWTAGAVHPTKDEDIAVQFASGGYYSCVDKSTCGRESLEEKDGLNTLLDNAPASFGGMLLRLRKGKYNYMCTRNNNFSNRSQKGTILVS